MNLLFADLFPFLLVFARVTGALMMIPGLGSQYINAPIRILFAMGLAGVMAPQLMDHMPVAPQDPFLFFKMVILEALVGLFIGTMGRLLLVCIELAGTVIGFQSGLTNAFVMNPVDGRQSSLPATYFSIVVMTLIFVADIHHLALQSIFNSYQSFHPGLIGAYENITSDFMQAIVHILTEGFMLGTQIAAPLIIMSMFFFVGMGLLNRLMPQLQVFFIAQPFQIFIGFVIMTLLVSSASLSILERLATMYNNLWQS
ncbi:MAG: flagellar biosynthetic protein FliR [Alphaproteobacteria bacterium]|nr:flagellar biosynthetic protein FliR [Alphaproteobacteria bacterium]